MVFGNQLSQVIDLVENRNPAVRTSVVNCDLSWQVKSPELILSWEVHKMCIWHFFLFLDLFEGSGNLGSWHSGSTFEIDWGMRGLDFHFELL